MSHFLVGVIIPTHLANDEKLIQEKIDIVMGPYSENEEVEPYEDTDGKPTTYNPDSRWDWYRVGGRWDGVVSKSGKRRYSEDNGFNFEKGHEEVKNNMCRVRELPVKSVPFAIVTPDGEWIEKGEMGWWGMTKGEMTERKWHNQVMKILKKYQDDYIVGLDCHI